MAVQVGLGWCARLVPGPGAAAPGDLRGLGQRPAEQVQAFFNVFSRILWLAEPNRSVALMLSWLAPMVLLTRASTKPVDPTPPRMQPPRLKPRMKTLTPEKALSQAL